MGRQDLSALESITRTLHQHASDDFNCDYRLDDAIEDHHAEMAVAGQIIMDLRGVGLTISKTRTPRPPKWRPMRDGVDYDSSEQ